MSSLRLACAVLVCIVATSAVAQDSRAELGALADATDSDQRPAFQIFDNVYYVGINFVSAYLVTTSEGLVLIDATYDRTVDHVLAGIEATGHDPADIKYILATHWHSDHFGGAPRIQAMTGAKVCMVGPDWDALDAFGGIPEGAVVRIEDEQTLTVGDTEFTFYHTPGHTLGTMSMAFDVRDGDDSYKAFTFGGAGLNFNGIDRTELYLQSVRRVQTFDNLQVALPNHAFMANVFERAEQLTARKPGEPHPFVAPSELQATWRQLIQDAELKLAQEKARAGL